MIRLTAIDRRRAVAAAAAALLHGGLLWALLSLTPRASPLAPPAMTLFDVPAPVARTVPPPAPPAPRRTPRPSAAAAPAARAARPTPVVAPPAAPRPAVMVAAPVAGDAADSAAGAAAAGLGTGAGGQGAGFGAGDAGDGDGGGGGRASWASGAIRDSDYPRAARRARAGGSVTAHFTVTPDGRVTGCRVVGSSGDADLDAATCRLIEARFRYRPATDARGRPIADVAGWRQDWWWERGR